MIFLLNSIRFTGSYLLLILTLFPGILFADTDPWPFIRNNIFAERDIQEIQSYVNLFAPEQAADASVVPISITLAPNIITKLEKLYLIIDRNPDPYAMEIEFYEGFRRTEDVSQERSIKTRVRVNNFSTVRVILETTDRELFMDKGFVAGSGGCSLPPASDMAEALKNIGTIKAKVLPDPNISEFWRQATIRIRHPNFTGMQPSSTEEDGFIPARYINKLNVKYGEEALMLIKSGITISENPAFRFNFSNANSRVIKIVAEDTDNTVFSF